ncbi:MAG: hypothetical protein KBS41_00420, partial [Oscillospiraceae bacterium]|nr:hypothetical protein [Candidatus Equicaccousia limihippi]
MKNYRYLLIDADDTVFDFLACESAAIKKVLKNHRLPYDDKTVATYSAINLKYWKMYERGEIKRDDIFTGRFSEFISLIKSNEEPSVINADYFAQLSNQNILMPNALSTLEY